MSFLKNILRKKNEPILTYEDFWNWFLTKEKTFFKVLKEGGNIEKILFIPLSAKLNKLRDGFWYLAGMCNDNTAELIITADGTIKNIVFIEELIEAAPAIEGWKFTALKPSLDIKDISISIAGFQFDQHNLHFYANDNDNYPDEINITIVCNNYTEENKNPIEQGIYILLDNYLGELNFALGIDNLNITGQAEANQELIPISKLKDYLEWRQKEFVEKYEGIRRDNAQDNYATGKAELESGNPLIAIINTDLMKWDAKVSHPWMLRIELPYDGNDNNGLPSKEIYQQLNEIENTIREDLKDFEGYLNIGRLTAENKREIYFACKEFRKPSKVLSKIQNDYAGSIEISYIIYKDKYWRSLERFRAK